MKWVKIKENENYSINENGEVRNDKKGTIKKPYINKQNKFYMLIYGAIIKVINILYTDC